MSKNYLPFTKHQYYSALARLYSQYNVITTPVNDIEHVFYLMENIASKYFDNKATGIVPEFKKTANPAVNFLTNIRGISIAKAKTICDELNCDSLVSLITLELNDLMQVKGIGKQTATKIIKAIKG